MEVAYLRQNWGLEYAKNVYNLWLACIIPVFYRSWTSCIEDRLQLVATAVVDRHGPVLTVSVQLPQHLANKKPVQSGCLQNLMKKPDRTGLSNSMCRARPYDWGASHHCLCGAGCWHGHARAADLGLQSRNKLRRCD